MSVSERTFRLFYPDRRWSGTLYFYERLRLELAPGRRVLNLGAGPGDQPGEESFSIRDLRSPDWCVYGCDPNQDVLKNSQLDEMRVMPSNGCIPFEKKSFDMVYSDYVLEHVAAPEEFLAEVFRVLKPGGAFYFRTPLLSGCLLSNPV
jgi:ubiquinone/menaquinone biosynthesis C-methylase UbiE